MRSLLLFCLLWLTGGAVAAEPLTLAAGAGYKKPMLELCQGFEAQSGIRTESLFGNMRQVLSQTEMSGKVALVVGDRSFLATSGQFDHYTTLGHGRLVIAVPKGSAPATLEGLADPAYQRVAAPHPQKAIYGRAADQALQRAGIKEQLGERLLVVATVPQVSAYLAAGTVDAGFINLTDALGLGDTIGGYTEVAQAQYDPIEIVAATVKGHEQDPAVTAFLQYLSGDEARAVLSRYGL